MLKVKEISLLSGNYGPDIILLHTNLPCGIWPFKGEATLRLEVAKGYGEDYCKEHFPKVPIEIIYLA